MNKMRKIVVVPILMGLSLLLALPFTASAETVRKVDNFIIFVDQSGSMNHHGHETLGKNKLKLAVDTIDRLDQAIPELGYTSTATVFSDYEVLAETFIYRNGVLGPVYADHKAPFNNWTPMGDGLVKLAPLVSNLSGDTALIMFTDGDSNEGVDAVAAARSLYAANPEELCIHIVSFADTEHGHEVIRQIRSLSDCSVPADVADLTSDAALQQFAQKVLYEEVEPKPARVEPKPAPAPAPVVKKPAPAMVKEVITFNLLFGFDKADITDEMIPVLEQAKMILEEDPDTDFVIKGHTDSTGPEAYNQGLSERRAAAVKDWLVNRGISADRLETIGYGETMPKFDNSTVEGRQLNRRVELESK